MSAVSNSTLSLYHTCPPGLGGNGCETATCNSTFVDPSARVQKPRGASTCPSCDAGFTGLNCNVCRGLGSCNTRQQQVGRGRSGIASSGLASINNTLTCHNQPKAITQANLECTIQQPTLSALFPGHITLTAIKVAHVPDWQTTGLSPWNASANSSYSQVFIDGEEQFYCQSTGCQSQNSTVSVGSLAPFGTESWTCGTIQCYCRPGTTICSNSVFPLGDVINGLSGSLDFSCDYIDPNDPMATTSCAFKSPSLTPFLGSGGLPLRDCTIGQCLSQYALEQDWATTEQVRTTMAGSHLSAGVIAGLSILGAAIALLLAVLAYGYYLLRGAKRATRERDHNAVGLRWEGICYSLKVGQGRSNLTRLTRRSQRRPESRHEEDGVELKPLEHVQVDRAPPMSGSILKNVSATAAPGSLTIVIGASGAGKSTLMDILGGRYKTGDVDGQLSFVGEPADLQTNSSRRRIAVLDQDDSACLAGYLTVRETLLFAAELSNPESMPVTERVDLVNSMLETLGLTSIAASRIGDARTRGISGGERRRVSLGVAIVARPKILIADEPTSGLDSYSAHRVVTALRTLASGPETGTTVIATLHQPSSEIFQMADAVLLLDRGSVAYEGPPSRAIDFCRDQNVPVPLGYNVADSLLSFAFHRSIDGAQTLEKSASVSGSNLDSNSMQLAFHHGGDRPVTTFMTQLHALLGRAYRMVRRDLSGPATHIVGAIVVALLTGGCFFQVKLDIGGFQNRVGSIIFVYILLLFASLSALTLFAKGRLLMMRERANGFYSPWSWATAHLVYDLVLLRALPATLITVIVYWMVGLHATASSFFQFLLITIIFHWVVSVYMMLLAALFEETSTAILFAGLFIIFNLAFAGFLLNLNNIPAVIRWVRWLSPSKYALEGVASEQLKGLSLIDNIGGVPITAQVSLISFKLFGFEENSYYRDLIILSCGFLIAFSLMLFAAVYWRMRERR